MHCITYLNLSYSLRCCRSRISAMFAAHEHSSAFLQCEFRLSNYWIVIRTSELLTQTRSRNLMFIWFTGGDVLSV